MEKNEAPNNVSSHTKNYEIAPFILGWRRDRTIQAFFFHVFYVGWWTNPLNLPTRGGLSRVAKFLAHSFLTWLVVS